MVNDSNSPMSPRIIKSENIESTNDKRVLYEGIEYSVDSRCYSCY
jgi:hypothetical protein